MEPNKVPNQPNLNNPDVNKSTVDDLHNEGIDIVAGSGASLDNEFSNETEASDVPTTSEEVPPPETSEKVPAKETSDPDKKKKIINVLEQQGGQSLPRTGFTASVPPVSSFVPPKIGEETERRAAVQPQNKGVTPSTQVNIGIPKQPIMALRDDGPKPSLPPTGTVPKKIETTPEQKPEAPGVPKASNDPSIKQLRTFKTDAEEAVRYQNVSKVDIAVAEQKKREANKTPIEYVQETHSSSKIFIGIVVLVVLILAGGWYYWFSSALPDPNAPVVQPTVMKTIVPYTKGSKLVLDEDSNTLTLIGAKLASSNAGLGNIYALVPVLNATSSIAAPLQNVLSGTTIPNKLFRSLENEYMFGAYTYDVNGSFLILKNSFFQNAFAGMLEWEKNLRNDLIDLIQVTHPEETTISANTDIFEDLVVSNIDARILKNRAGEIILAYAFADNNTIVIATNENTLKFVLDRLLTVRTIQ